MKTAPAAKSEKKDTTRLDWVQKNVTGQGTFIGINSDRTFSIWNHAKDQYATNLDLREAIDQAAKRVPGGANFHAPQSPSADDSEK